MVLKFSDPRLMHRTVPSGVDISAEYMFDETPQEDSPISRHFRGRKVLVTGITGFLGPLFLEKLLRVGADRVYVLCRAKAGLSAEERVERVFQEPIFVKLNTYLPDFRQKVRVINGDLTMHHLGLSNADDIELSQNIEFVIHAAAENRLSRQLWSLIRVNVQGTRELLRLCRRMNQLQLFVHISPAYIHSNSSSVSEQFRTTGLIDPNMMIGLSEVVHRDMLEILSRKIGEDWPDSYSFSRALAEEVVRRNSNRVPTTVVRPSMITSTSIDPIPGWSNNTFGLNGLLTGVAFGFIKLNRWASGIAVDFICADFVVNSTLAIIWDVCKSKTSEFEVPRPKVFHVTSGTQNAIDNDHFLSHLRHVGYELRTVKTVKHPFYSSTLFDMNIIFLNVLLNIFPAFVIDTYQKWSTIPSPPNTLTALRRMKSYFDRLLPYNRVISEFSNENVLTVYNRMTEFDKTRYPSDVRQLNWKQYIYEYALGARLYLVKEEFETVIPKVHRNTTLRDFSICGAMLMMLILYKNQMMF